MCTVIYIPKKDGTIFSSCRDENPGRSAAKHPAAFSGVHRQMLFPADGLAGGTWAGINDGGQIIILLNGGFENHIKKQHYRISRGLIVKTLLDSISPVEEWHDMDLGDIEPFTLIIYEHNRLHQLVWTGLQKIDTILETTKPHIWSSATLYPPTVQALRRKWFDAFITQYPLPDTLTLLHYLQHDAPADEINGFVMNRNEVVKTCSISMIEMKATHAVFNYNDLLNNLSSVHHFYFKESSKQVIVEEKPTAVLLSE